MALYDDASFIFLASGAAGLETKDASKAYNVKPAPITTGSELVTNGGFDADSDWTKSGEATISGGKGNIISSTGTYAALNQLNVFVIGKKYKISLDVTVNTNEHSFAIKLQDGAVDANIGKVTTSGSYVFYHTAAATTLTIARFSPNDGSGGNSATDVDVDNVSVFEVDTVPADFDISRDANLDATRVGPTGLIEKGRENLFRNTVFAGAGLNTEPTGGSKFIDSTGGTFDVTSTAGQIRFITASDERAFIQSHSVTTASLYSFSVFVDEVVTTLPVNRVISDSGEATDIRYEEDGVEISTSTNVQAGKRYTMVVNKTNTNSTRFRIGSGTSSQTAGDVTLSKPQLEVGIVATDYIENTSTSGSATAGIKEDEPRFDYPLAGGAPSLLLEPERANLVPQSEYFPDSQGTRVTVSVNTTETLSPEGVYNAVKMMDEATGDASHTHVIESLETASSLDNSTVYTVSAFVKDNGRNVGLNLASGTGLGTHAVFDLSGSGEALSGSKGSFTTTSIESYGNGWFRIIATGTTDSSAGATKVFIRNLDRENSNNAGYLGDATKGIYFYGVQLEEGPYASSYIPTHGAAATRTGEGEAVDTLKATLPTALNGASAYTLFMDLTVTDLEEETDFRDVVVFKDSSSASTKYAFKLETFTDSGTSSLRGFVYKTADPNAVGSNAHDTIAIGSRCKLAVVVNSASGVKYFYNGSSTPIMNYSEATTYESVDSIQGAEHTVPGTRSRTRIHAIHGYPSALSDAQCISLTTL